MHAANPCQKVGAQVLSKSQKHCRALQSGICTSIFRFDRYPLEMRLKAAAHNAKSRQYLFRVRIQ